MIQGIYGEIPAGLRLQKDFTGGHAIYLDGYYPGNPSAASRRPTSSSTRWAARTPGYQGDWWPAEIVDKFALAFGGGADPAMWAFPPGGVPPEVVGPDVVPIPPDSRGHEPTPEGEPRRPVTVGRDPGPDPDARPDAVGPIAGRAGRRHGRACPPSREPPVVGGTLGGIGPVPGVRHLPDAARRCPGAPSGIAVTFPAGDVTDPGAAVRADDHGRVRRLRPGERRSWSATRSTHRRPPTSSSGSEGVSPAAVGHARAMTSLDLFGQTDDRGAARACRPARPTTSRWSRATGSRRGQPTSARSRPAAASRRSTSRCRRSRRRRSRRRHRAVAVPHARSRARSSARWSSSSPIGAGAACEELGARYGGDRLLPGPEGPRRRERARART